MLSYKDDPFREYWRLRYYQFPSSIDVPSICKSMRFAYTSHMYSDNGTNFHSADQELQTSFQAMNSDPILQVILANDGV